MQINTEMQSKNILQYQTLIKKHIKVIKHFLAPIPQLCHTRFEIDFEFPQFVQTRAD